MGNRSDPERPGLGCVVDELSLSQREALTTIVDALACEREVVLTGAAGTGKTTLLKHLVKYLGDRGATAVFAAPTGKAAVRLSEVIGCGATTIHKRLYGRVDDDEAGGEGLVFGEPHAPCEPGEVLVVDEASMVGTELYNDVMSELPRRSQVIWVGDREQLQPVNDDWGPDLRNATAHLTEIFRQAGGSPIIGFATAIRTRRAGAFSRLWGDDDPRLTLRGGDVASAVSWAVERAREGADSTLITYTHRVRERANAAIREQLGFRAPIEVGDRLCVKMNSDALGLMNGQVIEVSGVVDHTIAGVRAYAITYVGGYESVFVLHELLNTRDRRVWDLRREFGRRKWDELRIIHAWHGHCLTVHSSQGSQWDEVGFIQGSALRRMWREDSDAARRLTYTAVTRAAEALTVFRS